MARGYCALPAPLIVEVTVKVAYSLFLGWCSETDERKLYTLSQLGWFQSPLNIYIQRVLPIGSLWYIILLAIIRLLG